MLTWRWPSKRAETCRQPNNKANTYKQLCFDSLKSFSIFQHEITIAVYILQQLARCSQNVCHTSPITKWRLFSLLFPLPIICTSYKYSVSLWLWVKLWPFYGFSHGAANAYVLVLKVRHNEHLLLSVNNHKKEDHLSSYVSMAEWK
jgi:hypothetical protein